MQDLARSPGFRRGPEMVAMTRVTLPMAVALTLGLGAVSGCDASLDPPTETSPTHRHGDDLQSGEQGLVVRTAFQLDGAQGVETLDVERLYLSIGVVFLTPMGEGSDSRALFASRQPFELDFDVAGGVDRHGGPTLVLPHGGTFAVSILLEPTPDYVDFGPKDDGAMASAVVSGLWWPLEDSNTRPDGADPSPLPWQPKQDDPGLPFVYRSDAIVRILVAEVVLDDRGEYEMVLSLGVDDWLRQSVAPAIRDAAIERRRDGEIPVDGPDWTPVAPLESTERLGLDGLLRDVSVHTSRR